jgi:hypothetical protein
VHTQQLWHASVAVLVDSGDDRADAAVRAADLRVVCVAGARQSCRCDAALPCAHRPLYRLASLLIASAAPPTPLAFFNAELRLPFFFVVKKIQYRPVSTTFVLPRTHARSYDTSTYERAARLEARRGVARRHCGGAGRRRSVRVARHDCRSGRLALRRRPVSSRDFVSRRLSLSSSAGEECFEFCANVRARAHHTIRSSNSSQKSIIPISTPAMVIFVSIFFNNAGRRRSLSPKFFCPSNRC